MTPDILAEEQLKLELIRVLSKFFLKHIEELVRNQTGAFFPVEKIENVTLGKRLGRRKELQLMTVEVADTLQNRKFNVDLAFKFFSDPEAAAEEGNGAVWLGEVLKNNFKVQTPQLLYFSRENSLLIYEGLREPREFFDSELDQPQKFFLAGMALPYVHGIFKHKVFVDRYLHLISKVVKGLNVAPGDKNELFSLFKEEFRRIGLSEAGANCFGDYHPGNIMFKEKKALTSNTGDLKIDRTDIYLIDPTYLDKAGNVDRAEDIGTFFSKFAYNDFYLSQSFDKAVTDFELICKGYDYTISRNGIKLEEYYPNGTTFDFHIALGILIDTMFKIRNPKFSNPQSRINTSLEAVMHILKKHPFEI
ncbi:MAG: hypothetical protein JSU57_02685 [Candidatus Heimdallarchaeota archaeon]|nr:MAG: hypothetical protein JSU57_02685 [Candidatus Heimdallarchaeota archaeon]